MCGGELLLPRQSLNVALEGAAGKERQCPQADDKNSQGEQGYTGLDGPPGKGMVFQFNSAHVDSIELEVTRAASPQEIKRVAQETSSASC